MPFAAHDGEAAYHAKFATLVNNPLLYDPLIQGVDVPFELAHFKIELSLHLPVFGHPTEGATGNHGTICVVGQAFQRKNDMVNLKQAVAMEFLIKSSKTFR